MIVTIARQYGSAAAAVGRLVAEDLDAALVHDELPAVVATRLGISREAAEGIASSPPRFAERLLRGLAVSTPEASHASLPPDEIDTAYVREIERAVRERATLGPCVILGRAAGHILAGRADLVTVFLHAPLAWRIVRVSDSLGCGEREARREIERVDAARADYTRERYGVEWRDAAHYTLALDVAACGIEGAAELIVRAARAAAR
jgi:cytidylate kinase